MRTSPPPSRGMYKGVQKMLKWRPHRYFLYGKRFSPQLSWIGLLVLVTLWTALFAGCAGFGGSNPSPAGPAGVVLVYEFSPKVLHINGGEMGSWVNKGTTITTGTAVDCRVIFC